MTRSNERDESIDTLLRSGLRTSPAGDAPGACVDAEVIAAWAEGRQPPGEAAKVEAHLSSCASCQELLAVFARTEPLVVSGFSWTRWRLQWAVPLAAAATAAAIWVAIPEDRGADEFERTVAPAISEAQPAPPASAPVEASPALNQAPALEKREAASRRDAPRSSLESREEREGFADSADSAQPREANERDQDRKAEPVPLSAAAPRSVAAAPQTATGAAPAQDESRLRAAGAPAELLRKASGTEVASPDPLVRWRIAPKGRLERSTNGGKTWEPVPFLQSIEVVDIQAPTATRAVVTAADGRQFRTDDQGKSWVALTN